MDDIDDNQNKPRQELEKADTEMLQSAGIEIVDREETAAEKEDAIAKKTAEMMGMPSNWATGKTTGPTFTQKSPIVSGKTGDIKSVRTYKTDVEEAVQGNKTSVINMVVAESQKKERMPMELKKDTKPRGLLWFSIILILIALLVVAGTYYFLVIIPGNSTPATENVQTYYPPLIQVQSTKTLPIDSNDPKNSFKNGVTNLSSVPVGTTVNLVPLNASGNEIATSSTFFSSIGITLPTQINLSLNGLYTLGTVVSSPNHPFLILGLSSYENAFAGMLGWEKTMHNDLSTFIQIEHPDEPAVSITPIMFVDKTINNQDVRELMGTSGSPLLLYAFIGTTRLVITTDIETMSSIITALNTTNTTR